MSTEVLGREQSIQYSEGSINKLIVVNKSSNTQASFTLFKVFVGCGILTLPSSFAKVGIVPGISWYLE